MKQPAQDPPEISPPVIREKLFDHRPMSELPDNEFRKKKGEELHRTRIADKKPYAFIKTIGQIKRQEINWLWPGRIAIGKLTLIAGDPGVSKSLLTIDLAARISTGVPFPDNAPAQQGNVIFLSLEDDVADTIRPRLEAARADLDRCHILKGKINPQSNGPLRSSFISLQEIDILKDSLRQIEAGGGFPKLIIIDPVDSFQGGIDSNTNDVRELLTPLAVFAEQEAIAVVLIKHLNKNQQGKAAYRVNGHISYTAIVRSSWMIIKSPRTPEKRLFLCQKNNLGKDNSGLAYRISEDHSGTPFLEWFDQPVTENLEELLSQSLAPKSGSIERDRILNFLSEHSTANPTEISKGIGKSITSVSNMLRKLEERGYAQRVGHGRWELSSKGRGISDNDCDESDESTQQQTANSADSSPVGRQLNDESQVAKNG